MKDPKEIETLKEKSSYGVPIYKVSNEGLVHEGNYVLGFCKGNKEDSTVYRQAGFLTETLLAVCKQYLVENNTGDLKNEDTSAAIDNITKALQNLQDRADKRKAAGTLGTYKK